MELEVGAGNNPLLQSSYYLTTDMPLYLSSTDYLTSCAHLVIDSLADLLVLRPAQYSKGVQNWLSQVHWSHLHICSVTVSHICWVTTLHSCSSTTSHCSSSLTLQSSSITVTHS